MTEPFDQYGRITRRDRDVPALARTVSSSISASTEITLNSATKLIIVYASTKDVYLKWGIDDCAPHTFDEIIVAGDTPKVFPIPLQADGTPYNALNVLQREATATVVVIEK